jgi:hypothetical protein
VARLQYGQSWLRFPDRIKKFVFFKTLKQALVATHPQRRIFPAAKQLERGFPNSALCPTAVENVWSYISPSPPPNVFMTRTRGVLPFTFVWILVEHGGMQFLSTGYGQPYDSDH